MKMNVENKYEKMVELLNGFEDFELRSVWNDYCLDVNSEDEIYDMDSFNMYYSDSWEATRAAFYGDFCPTHNYFQIKNSNLYSTDYLSDTIDIVELSEYIVDNNEDFDYGEISDLLSDFESEEE